MKLTRHKAKQITLFSPLSLKRRHFLCPQLLLTSCFRLPPCLWWSLLFAPDIANQLWQPFFVCHYQSQRYILPPRGLSCLSDSFSNFFLWFSDVVFKLASTWRLTNRKMDAHHCLSISFCTSDLAFLSISSYLFLSLFALKVSVLSSFNWKLCTAWSEKNPFSGTLNWDIISVTGTRYWDNIPWAAPGCFACSWRVVVL